MYRLFGLPVFLGLCATFATWPAVSQTRGFVPSNKSTQSPQYRDREAVEFFNSFDLNHADKVAHNELNATLAQRFSAGTRGSGSMTENQFAAQYAQRVQQRIKQMFLQLDWNGDGKLSLDEYAAPLRVRFENFDHDGKGTESCASNAVIRASYQPNSSFGHARFCAEQDLNGDGIVTHAEFDGTTAKQFASLTSGARVMSAEQFATDMLAHYRTLSSRIFQRLDADHNGTLSLAEFSASDQRTFGRLDQNRDGVVTRDEVPVRRYGGARRTTDKHG
jgi:Ca2+-binding EF-hand superfamily protein